MPPSRFAQVSRWRNLESTPAKAGVGRYEEIGLAPQPDNAGSTLLLASPSAPGHILARAAGSPKSLLVLDANVVGKLARKVPSFVAAPAGASALADWDVAPWKDGAPLLAAGGSDGSVVIRELQLGSEDPSASEVARIAAPAGSKPVVAVKFHPTTANLLLVATADSLKVWDITARGDESSLIIELEAPKKIVDARWSLDGKLLAVAGVQGSSSVVSLYDPRNGAAPIATSPSHASASKPTRLTFISASSPALLTTGFDANASRQWSLFDVRSLSKGPVAQVSLDVGSSVLEPVADADRGLVYLSSRTGTSLHWLDIGTGEAKAPSASGTVALPTPSGGAVALAPVSTLDVMKGEVARILVASAPGAGPSNDQITPVTITIPRRQYIDFHADLYPDTRTFAKPALSAQEWIKGADKDLRLVSLDPAKREESEAVEQAKPVPVEPKAASEQKTPAPAPAPTSAPVSKAEATPVAAAPAAVAATAAPSEAPAAKAAVSAASSLPAPARASAATSATAAAPAASATPLATRATQPTATRKPAAASSAPRWSRRFLSGHTPLISTYQNLSTLDISRAPDARMLAHSSSLIVLPLSGPGGRLALHNVGQGGRLPAPLPEVSCGSVLGDFTLDRFDARRVITTSEDGKVRVWDVPQTEELGSLDSPSKTIEIAGAARLGELAVHPSVKGLLALAPADAEGQLHLLDLDDAADKPASSFSVPGGGVFALAWSPDGRLLVTANRDKELRIIDPRAQRASAQVLAQSAAHATSRSFRAIWLSNSCVASVGHGAGSTRELLVFTYDSNDGTLKKVASQALDVSPAVLFPHWDADTGVLWLWSKGERSISAFEIILTSSGAPAAKDAIQALPAFQHSQPQLGLSFGRKADVDVKNVEIATSLRLSRGELQEVSWRIPRARAEFFQDDIFVPTAADEPRVEAKSWLEGNDGPEARLVDLCPTGMDLLSTAAAPRSKSTLPKGPIAREETETERSEKFLSSVFAKAKLDDSEAQVGAAARRAPDDDDWGSD